MRLESIPKYFAPKSPTFSDAPRATASDVLTGTDIMAALGLADLKGGGGFGLELFLAKQGISTPYRAVDSLYRYAQQQVIRHKAFSKQDESTRLRALKILSVFAYQDYSRSAASVRTCECCQGEGFIEERKFVMNTLAIRRETVSMLERGDLPTSIQQMPGREMFSKHTYYDITQRVCIACNGKGVISNACRCKGRGQVLDKDKTKEAGIPVMKQCCKCSGRGYSRLPAENVRKTLLLIGLDIPETTWRRGYKPFYEKLITRCHQEESLADDMLSSVTV